MVGELSSCFKKWEYLKSHSPKNAIQTAKMTIFLENLQFIFPFLEKTRWFTPHFFNCLFIMSVRSFTNIFKILGGLGARTPISTLKILFFFINVLFFKINTNSTTCNININFVHLFWIFYHALPNSDVALILKTQL